MVHTILNKLFLSSEKTCKLLVFSQKIFDCSGSKIAISLFCICNSLHSLLILWSIESLGPSILIAVIAPSGS